MRAAVLAKHHGRYTAPSSSFNPSGMLLQHDFNNGNYGPYVPSDRAQIAIVSKSGGGYEVELHYQNNPPGSIDNNVHLDATISLKLGQSLFTRRVLRFNADTTEMASGRKLSYMQARRDSYSPATWDCEGWVIPVCFGLDLSQSYGNATSGESNAPIIVGKTFATGVDYVVEQQITMNSTFVATDGIYRLWVDGVLHIEAVNTTYSSALWTTCVTAWNSGTTYGRDGVVKVGGSVYVSRIDGNLNNPPASSPTQWFIPLEANQEFVIDTVGDQINSAVLISEHRYIGGPLYYSSQRIGAGPSTISDPPDTITVPPRFTGCRWYDAGTEKATWNLVPFYEHTNIYGLAARTGPTRLSTISNAGVDGIVNGTAQLAYINTGGGGTACYAIGTPATANQSVTVIQKVQSLDGTGFPTGRYAHTAFVRRDEATDSHYSWTFDSHQYFTIQQRKAGTPSNIAFQFTIPTLSVGDILDYTFTVATVAGNAVLTLTDSLGATVLTVTDSTSPILGTGTSGVIFSGLIDTANPTTSGFSYLQSSGVEV